MSRDYLWSTWEGETVLLIICKYIFSLSLSFSKENKKTKKWTVRVVWTFRWEKERWPKNETIRRPAACVTVTRRSRLVDHPSLLYETPPDYLTHPITCAEENHKKRRIVKLKLLQQLWPSPVCAGAWRLRLTQVASRRARPPRPQTSSSPVGEPQKWFQIGFLSACVCARAPVHTHTRARRPRHRRLL